MEEEDVLLVTLQCTLHTVRFTLFTVHCKLNTAHGTLCKHLRLTPYKIYYGLVRGSEKLLFKEGSKLITLKCKNDIIIIVSNPLKAPKVLSQIRCCSSRVKQKVKYLNRKSFKSVPDGNQPSSADWF